MGVSYDTPSKNLFKGSLRDWRLPRMDWFSSTLRETPLRPDPPLGISAGYLAIFP